MVQSVAGSRDGGLDDKPIARRPEHRADHPVRRGGQGIARLAAQHDPTDYELEYGELRRPMFASPDENGTAVNAAEGAGGEQARIHSVEALHRLGRF